MSETVPSWMSKRTFYLAAINYAVGLMTPRLTSMWLIKTKLGIFVLLPLQLLVMMIVTVPCIFVELTLGQYSNKDVLQIWDFCPILRGVGFCCFFFFVLYQMYFNILTTHALVFTVLSLKLEPQWKSCNNSWNTMNCYTFQENSTYQNECRGNCSQTSWETSMVQFYLNRIVNADEQSGNIGFPQYELLLYNLITMILIFLANSNGVKFFGKVLLILPIISAAQVLILFLIPVVESGFESLTHLLEDVGDITQLKSINVWHTLIETATCTSGLGFGAFITLGTQSFFRNPLHFKSIFISFSINLCVFVYNITVQNFLISLKVQNNLSTDDFISLAQKLNLPEAVFFFPQSNRFWVTIWFWNKYMLGLASLIVMMFFNTKTIFNLIPKTRKHKPFCVFLCCCFICYGGIIFATRIGYLLIQILDQIICDHVLILLNTIQLFGVVYVYGIRNFSEDIGFMLGIKLSSFWKCLFLLNPIVLGSILIYRVVTFYSHMNNTLPLKWFHTFQQTILWFCFGCVILFGSVHVVKSLVILKTIRIFKSSDKWGPGPDSLKKSRKIFAEAPEMAREYVYRQDRLRMIE